MDRFFYILEEIARLLDYFLRVIVKADDFALLAHHREVSIGLAFLGLYLDKSSHGCHFNYHCLLSSGMFLSVAHPLRYQ